MTPHNRILIHTGTEGRLYVSYLGKADPQPKAISVIMSGIVHKMKAVMLGCKGIAWPESYRYMKAGLGVYMYISTIILG